MPHAVPVQIEYSDPLRSGEKTPCPELVWCMQADDPVTQEHSEFIMSLDPAFPMEEVARRVDERFDHFLCPRCEESQVFNGQNGSGTQSLKCNECGKRPSIWNTYDLSIFKHKILGVLGYRALRFC